MGVSHFKLRGAHLWQQPPRFRSPSGEGWLQAHHDSTLSGLAQQTGGRTGNLDWSAS